MVKRYLITGGFGLIGSQLANMLEGDITIASRTETNKERVKKNVSVLLKSITELTIEDLQNIDVIYHCASTVDNYNVLTDPYIDMETNIRGTIHLLELCKQLEKKPLIIFPSTFFVYGNQYEKTGEPITEESSTDPLALYPATKLCAESAIKLYSNLYGIPYLICRLTNVYGEQESFTNKKKGALNFLIMQAVNNEPFNVYKGGNFHRDYIHVDDVVSALTFLETHATNDTFLVGFGTPVLFKDLIDIIMNVAKSTSKITEIDPPPFHAVVGIRSFVADTTKIQSLGWKARISPADGLTRVVHHYQQITKPDHDTTK